MSGTAAQPIIRFEQVRMAYGAHVALHDLSLAIPQGRVLGLLGPNGAGKTTLLRLLLGLLRPQAGHIALFGGLHPGSARAARQIGYMPQGIALYDNLSVQENVRFYGHLYGVPRRELERRCDEVLQRVALTERADTPAYALSGGMQRRAMLATALVHRPSLLVLDEPTAGVDPMLRIAFWQWFAGLAEEGTSILMTTHHIAEAVRCDEVLFLRAGHLLERGEPRALMGRYGVEDLEAAFVRATEAGGLSGGEGTP